MRAILCAALLWSGCGGGDAGTDLEGIYQIESWLVATGDCEATGQSVLAARGHQMAFVKHYEFFGESFVAFVQCPSAENCAAVAQDEDTVQIGRFAFDGGNDERGWTGTRLTLRGGGGADCQGDAASYKMTGSAAASVDIVEDKVSVTDIPHGADGFCDDDAAEAAARGRACEIRETVHAVFVQQI